MDGSLHILQPFTSICRAEASVTAGLCLTLGLCVCVSPGLGVQRHGRGDPEAVRSGGRVPHGLSPLPCGAEGLQERKDARTHTHTKTPRPDMLSRPRGAKPPGLDV